MAPLRLCGFVVPVWARAARECRDSQEAARRASEQEHDDENTDVTEIPLRDPAFDPHQPAPPTPRQRGTCRVFRLVSGEGVPSRGRAGYGRSRTETGMATEFVDISSYQQGADIAAYAAGGFRRILLKATEGTTYTNPHFAPWWHAAGALGLSRGAYHFARPSKSGGAVEADHFAGTLRAAGGPGPRDWLCLDTEDPDERGPAAAEHAARFCERMVALGFGAGVVYSGTWYLRPAGLEAAMLPAGWRQLHIANFSQVHDADVPLPPGWSRDHVVARQYTDKAHLPGMPGDVDANRVVREWLKGDVVTPEQMKELKDAVKDAAGAVPANVSALFTEEFRRANHRGKTTADVRFGTASEAEGITFLAVADLQERVGRVENQLAGIAEKLDAILARDEPLPPPPPPASPPPAT